MMSTGTESTVIPFSARYTRTFLGLGAPGNSWSFMTRLLGDGRADFARHHVRPRVVGSPRGRAFSASRPQLTQSARRGNETRGADAFLELRSLCEQKRP